MPDTKYANLYEEVEFPMPETFYDDYSTRCDAARTQEMRIDDDMTMTRTSGSWADGTLRSTG